MHLREFLLFDRKRKQDHIYDNRKNDNADTDILDPDRAHYIVDSIHDLA